MTNITKLHWNYDELIGTWDNEEGIILQLNSGELEEDLKEEFKLWLIEHIIASGLTK